MKREVRIAIPRPRNDPGSPVTVPSQHPFVSAIVVTHNRPRFLIAAVSSVLRQTLASIEVVIVDDGSTDETEEETARLAASDARVRVFRQANAGPGAARNAGIAQATADWVAFLDDDDLWTRSALEELLAAAMPGHDVIACHALRFFSDEPAATAEDILAAPEAYRVEYWPPNPPREGLTLREVMLRPVAPIHAGVFRREAVREIGGFDTSSGVEDYDLWLRLASRGPTPVVPRPLALYRWHPGQRSSPLGTQARETRITLERFFSRNIDSIPERDRWRVHRRLALLAREEAYASLLRSDGSTARSAITAGLRWWPRDLKLRFYWLASRFPSLYTWARQLFRKS